MYLYYDKDCIRVLMMVSTHVDFQTTRLTKTLLAHVAFKRFLVRVNTHVDFQITSCSTTLLANIALIRFLVRVSTHVDFQSIGITKTLLAHIALALPSLSLRSFLIKSRFFFLYLMMICFEIILLVGNPQTQHQRFFFFHFFFFISRNLQNRPRVHRSFRMWILSSSRGIISALRDFKRESREVEY